MEDDASAFAGVAFHCYEGSVSDQDTFHNAFPSTVCFLSLFFFFFFNHAINHFSNKM